MAGRDLVVRYEGETAGLASSSKQAQAQILGTAKAAEAMSKRFEQAAARAGRAGGNVGAGLLKGVVRAAGSTVVNRAGQQIGNKLYDEASKRVAQSSMFQKLQPSAAKAGMLAGSKVAQGVERQVSKTNWDRLKSPKVAIAAAGIGLVFGRRFMASAESQIKPEGLSSKLTGGLGRGLKAGALGAVAGVAGLGFAAARGLQATVKASSDAQQSIGAVGAIFGRYSKGVQRDALAAARTVGLSANSYRELASTLGSTLKNKGIDDFAGKTKGLIGLGADLSAVYGGTAKDAVEALTSTLRGETDPIEKYGVTINQAAIQQEALRLGLTKSKGALTGQAQAMAALSLINKQTKSAQGQFIAQSGTYAEKLQIAAAGFDNLKVQIGDKFLPVATQAMGFVADKAIPRISKWIGTTKGLGPVVGQLVPLLTGLGRVAGTIFKPAAGAGLKVYTSGLRGLINFVTTHQASLIGGLKAGANTALDLGQALVNAGVSGLQGVAALSNGVAGFVESGHAAIGGLLSDAAAVAPLLGPAASALANTAVAEFQKTDAGTKRFVDGLKAAGKGASDAGALLGNTLNPALQATRDRMNAAANQEIFKAKQRDAATKFAIAVRGVGLDAKGSEVHLKSWASRTGLGAAAQGRLERQVKGAGKALQGQIEAQRTAGAGQAKLSRTWEKGKDKLYDEFRQMGLSRAEAGKLATKYAGIKPKVSTKFSAPGAKQAKTDADAVKDAVNGIPSKKTISIYTREYTKKQQASGHGPTKMATGGVWAPTGSGGSRIIRAASGRVLPGWSPGRDIHRFYSATAGELDLSGGEAIMRPEFTRAVGGPSGVARWNHWAKTGELGQGLADGGVPEGPLLTAPGTRSTRSTPTASQWDRLDRLIEVLEQQPAALVEVTADSRGIEQLVTAKVREALRKQAA